MAADDDICHSVLAVSCHSCCEPNPQEAEGRVSEIPSHPDDCAGNGRTYDIRESAVYGTAVSGDTRISVKNMAVEFFLGFAAATVCSRSSRRQTERKVYGMSGLSGMAPKWEGDRNGQYAHIGELP